MSERNRPRSPALPPDDDPSIPVLTERLTLPALEIDFTLPPLPPAGPVTDRAEPPLADTAPMAPLVMPAAPALSPAPAAPLSGRAPQAGPPAAPPRVIGEHAPAHGVDAGHEPQLAHELREAVLRGVAERLPQDVDRLVRERFAPAVEASVRAALEQAAGQMASQLAAQVAAQMASQLAAQIASQLAPQVATRLGPQLAAQVTAQVAAQLTAEAQRALSGAVHDVVEQAVTVELDRLRAGR